jgi:glycine dehydrogenase subunit 1
MFKYFPHTEQDIQEMLDKIGVQSIDELFLDLPKKFQTKPDYQVPLAKSEIELRNHFKGLSSKNRELIIFRGAGAYDHYTPSVIPAIISREEFLTAYTPYQPEIAQGTLQYIFEFQSMITDLTGMDVSNASMYDGPTATAEAMFMAVSQTRKNKIVLSDNVNPNVIDVVKTYALYRGIEVLVIPSKAGLVDRSLLDQALENAAGFIGQVPNYFGLVENLTDVSEKVQSKGGIMIINADPQVLETIESPRKMKADIACGECQSLGIPLSYGGAYVGYLGTTEKLLRKMPGRICGVTTDVDGKRAFVLTLQAREQHIRREKANSNICSNQSLMALWTTIYMSTMGKQGLKEVVAQCYQNSHYLQEQLIKTGLFKPVHNGFFIKEFLLEASFDLKAFEQKCIQKGILPGLIIHEKYMLFAVTEKRTVEEMDLLVSLVGGAQ